MQKKRKRQLLLLSEMCSGGISGIGNAVPLAVAQEGGRIAVASLPFYYNSLFIFL